MVFRLESSAFANGGDIPRKYTGEGDDLSPPLRWEDPPPGTQSYVLIVDDPDAPRGTFTHWILFDIPAHCTELPEGIGVRTVGRSGRNDFGTLGYRGPHPPVGHGPHRYYFRLYALDRPTLGLGEGASRVGVERALRGHVLATAEWMGRYERRAHAHAHRT